MNQRAHLQRKNGDAAERASLSQVVHETLRSPGRPLDAATRAFMEPRFGHDFGQVQVHADEQAAESARAVSALAYTVGSDLVFGAGQYAPGTSEGQRLIAHELAHAVQQNGRHPDFQGDLTISQSGDTAEIEAKAIAGQVMAGQPVQVQVAQGAAIARAPEDEEYEIEPVAVTSSADAPTSFPGDITAEPVELPPTTTNDVTEVAVEGTVDMGQGGAGGNPDSDLPRTDGTAGTGGAELSSDGSGAGGAGGVEVRPIDGGGGAVGTGGAELSNDSGGGAGGAGGVEVRPVDGGGGARGASGSPEAPQEGNGGVPEWLHTTLDVVGLIPGVGDLADLANAGLYAAEGRNEEALLSAAAAIPFLGDEVTLGKLAAKGEKELAKAGVKKGAKEVVEAGAEKGAKEVVEAGAEKGAKETVEAGAEKESKELAGEGAERELDAGNGGDTPNGDTAGNNPPVRKGPIPDEEPASIAEQIALQQARAGEGREIMRNLGDEPRLVANYGPGEWVKMEHTFVTHGGQRINVHWFRNKTTGQSVELKFKDGEVFNPLHEARRPEFTERTKR